MSISQTISPQIPPKYLLEDGLSDECKTLLSTLPKQRSWLASHDFYNYQRFWLDPRLLGGVLACQQQFQAQESDIILVTTPKSGFTWVKSLLFTLMNRKKYSIFEQDHPLLVKNTHDLVPWNSNSMLMVKLLATHMSFGSLPKPIHDSRTKLVYLCRNPRDAFISMWHFSNNLKPDHTDIKAIEECFDLFCKGANPYGPFWNHVLDYWKESIEKPNKVLFLMYEEIKAQPKLQLKRLVEFLECQFSIEEEKCGVVDEILRMCSFDNLSNLEVNRNGKLSSGEKNKVFFRRGEVGDWKNYFTKEMSEKIDNIIKQKFQGSGLKDNLSEECKKLLSILPKEKGWIGLYIYNYQSFWISPRLLQGVIACQQQFQAQDSDIFLVTNPKSGTIWLKSLLFALVNRMKHPMFEQNHPLLTKNPHDLVPFLELTLYVDGQVPDFSSFTTPRLLSTHLPFASLPKSVQDSKPNLFTYVGILRTLSFLCGILQTT
ncbi:hypothetical protein H5410_025114 [Solanum commersonii]|uniref:Sulfotransferase n=1 Tax=Solanum commersonii TaxID=4109 RepID=A0A9J5YXK9_SOLCO|nr:hypothetical protein H5410_025114 [Solanum commersonii]